MFRTRVCSIVLALALAAAAFTRPAAGQASRDRDKICSQVQNRTLAVGHGINVGAAHLVRA